MAAITDIIHKVLERTNQDKVPWETTIDDDTFVAVIGNLSVSLSYENRVSGYLFQILNEEGREIGSFSTYSAPPVSSDVEGDFEDYQKTRQEVRELYGKARHTALQVDRKLDELLTELTKEG